jgi:hypothetical protein
LVGELMARQSAPAEGSCIARTRRFRALHEDADILGRDTTGERWQPIVLNILSIAINILTKKSAGSYIASTTGMIFPAIVRPDQTLGLHQETP